MRETTTRFVLLGALAAAGPLTGYEMRAWIATELGGFWSESFGQIYPALRGLAADGLAAAAEAAGDGKPYRITPQGREALQAWLARPPRPERPRNELLARLHFGRFLGTETVRRLLAAAREAARTRAEDLAAETAQLKTRQAGEALVFARLTAERGLALARAEADWAERALKAVTALEDGGPDAALRELD
jgi:DNA-binding PadR family transcriptional regulator